MRPSSNSSFDYGDSTVASPSDEPCCGITTWQVYNEKLYLNLNHDILAMFKNGMDGHIAKADKNWPGLVEKNGK
jgi:hypothetical protein